MDSMRLLMRGSRVKVDGQKPSTHATAVANPLVQSSASIQDPTSRKRKRKEAEDGDDEDVLSPEDIRRLHHQGKIKITDLRALHAQDKSESRKAQKQTSRLYPRPLQRFSSLRDQQVNSALLENMIEQGYKHPTEVQMAAIPLLMADNNIPDLITISPTGSGKTLAFMIPLINRVSHEHKSQNKDSPTRQVSAIVLAPTKELVNQIVNEGRKLAARTGVRITAFKKGMKLLENISKPQEKDPEDSEDSEIDSRAQDTIVKADILVSTPLSLLHAITREQHDADDDDADDAPSPPLPLPNITTFVLDEADILLDPLFRTQTLSIWSAFTNPNLRTSLWSATIGSNIEEIASSTINARYSSSDKLKSKSKSNSKSKSTSETNTKTKETPPLLRIIIGLKDTSLPNITHKLIFSSTEPGKLTALRNLIRPPPSQNGSTGKAKSAPILRPPFLIFTQTIPRAESLHNEIKYDIPPPTSSSSSTSTTNGTTANDTPPRIALLHSSLTTPQRAAIMTHFRQGKIWILITTDLLSRGIDFRGVNGVVNYDIPTTSASYVHRAGRTGRAGKEGGVCVTLYTKEDVMYLRGIANVIRKSTTGTFSGGGQGSGIPDWLLDSLPSLTKDVKKELKERGVDVRRAVKESDDRKERRRKGRNMIGTTSGYDKKLRNNRREMIEASKRRKREGEKDTDRGDGDDVRGHRDGDGVDEFDGFD